MPRRRQKKNRSRLGDAIGEAAACVALLAIVKGIELLLGISLAGFGILPRDPHGLIGVIFAPLLHGSLAHLLANSGPLFVLLVLLLMDSRYRPGATITWIWLVSGLGTWILGRAGDAENPIVHIGASSIIYGLVSYLIAAGFRMRSWRPICTSLAVGLAYGGIFYGVLPNDGLISWEGHLAGAVAGLWAADRQHR